MPISDERRFNMKNEYIAPDIELVRLEMIDIITSSDLDYIPDEDELPLVPVS